MYNATYQIVIIRVVFLSIETVLGVTYLDSLNGKCQVFINKGRTRKKKSTGISRLSLATRLSGHAHTNQGQKLISTYIEFSEFSRLSDSINKILLVHALFIILEVTFPLFYFHLLSQSELFGFFMSINKILVVHALFSIHESILAVSRLTLSINKILFVHALFITFESILALSGLSLSINKILFFHALLSILESILALSGFLLSINTLQLVHTLFSIPELILALSGKLLIINKILFFHALLSILGSILTLCGLSLSINKILSSHAFLSILKSISALSGLSLSINKILFTLTLFINLVCFCIKSDSSKFSKVTLSLKSKKKNILKLNNICYMLTLYLVINVFKKNPKYHLYFFSKYTIKMNFNILKHICIVGRDFCDVMSENGDQIDEVDHVPQDPSAAHDYAVYEIAYDATALQREMARLEINAEGNVDFVAKTAAEVEKDMSVMWRVMTIVNDEVGPIRPDNAFVMHNIPYTTRSIIPGSLEDGWEKVDVEMRKNGERSSLEIFMPPERPIYVICGASHVENLSKISYSYSANKDVQFNSLRTAFVIFAKGTAEWFSFWGNLAMANLSTQLKNHFEDFNIESYFPVLLLMSPFTWNIGHSDEYFFTHDDKRVNIPFAKTMAKHLMKASQQISGHFAGNPIINWGLGWLDCPILPKAQVKSHRLNKLVREVNFLLDPNLPICRSWRVALTTERPSNSKRLEVSGLEHLHFDMQKYGRGKGLDNGNLSDQGSAAYLLSIYTGWGQGLRDRNSILDFPQCRPAISVAAYQNSSYFAEVQELRQAVSDDTTSAEAEMALNVMEAIVVDVSSVNFTIRHKATTNNFGFRGSNPMVMKSSARERKAEAYNKRKNNEEERRNGFEAGTSGRGNFRR